MSWFDRLLGKILELNGRPADGSTAHELILRERLSPKPIQIALSADGTTYTIYTTEYDEEVSADELDAALEKLGKPISDALLERWQEAVDRARPAVEAATERFKEQVFGLEPEQLAESTVTLLIDHSGSMRGSSIEAAAVTAAALTELLPVRLMSVEVLGFTTRSWRGGRSRQLWLEHDRSPAQPGRLCDLRHIIYRSAGAPAAASQSPFRHMLRSDLLRENIDGEALQWAVGRIRSRPQMNKLIVVLCDGAPADDSTNANNPTTMLADHLHTVASDIENAGDVSLHAIGIEHDPSLFYRSAVMVTTASHLPGATMHSVANWLCGRAAHQSSA